jgi:hypothetical protein
MQCHLQSRTGNGFKNKKNVLCTDPKIQNHTCGESIWTKGFETNQVQCNHTHDNSNQKDLIKYLHAAYFSPVK